MCSLNDLYLESLKLDLTLTQDGVEKRLYRLSDIVQTAPAGSAHETLALGLWAKLFANYSKSLITNDDPREKAVILAFRLLSKISCDSAMARQIAQSLLALDYNFIRLPGTDASHLHIIEADSSLTSAVDSQEFPTVRDYFRQTAIELIHGKLIDDKGIFLRKWQSPGGKHCAIFASPIDLTDSSGKRLCAPFQVTVNELAAKKDWYGHDGAVLPVAADQYERELSKGIENGTLAGKWFIPSCLFLYGQDQSGNPVPGENLYKSKDSGAFKNSYVLNLSDDHPNEDWSGWYWSNSPDGARIKNIRFADGKDGGNGGNLRMNCRPCRIEELDI